MQSITFTCVYLVALGFVVDIHPCDQLPVGCALHRSQHGQSAGGAAAGIAGIMLVDSLFIASRELAVSLSPTADLCWCSSIFERVDSIPGDLSIPGSNSH